MPQPELAVGLVQPFGWGLAYEEAIHIPDPAVASDLIYTVTGRYWERIPALGVTLVTDANAGNRFVSLQVRDADAQVLAAFPAAAVQTAALTRRYSFVSNLSAASGPLGGFYFSPAPLFFLQPGWTARVVIDTVKAGDQLSLAVILRERFPTGAAGYPMGGMVPEEDHRTPLRTR